MKTGIRRISVTVEDPVTTSSGTRWAIGTMEVDTSEETDQEAVRSPTRGSK
jgi:hypothetical protein